MAVQKQKHPNEPLPGEEEDGFMTKAAAFPNMQCPITTIAVTKLVDPVRGYAKIFLWNLHLPQRQSLVQSVWFCINVTISQAAVALKRAAWIDVICKTAKQPRMQR